MSAGAYNLEHLFKFWAQAAYKCLVKAHKCIHTKHKHTRYLHTQCIKPYDKNLILHFIQYSYQINV